MSTAKGAADKNTQQGIHATGKRVPESYERVYTSVCPQNENRITRHTFMQLCRSTMIGKEAADAIWSSVDLNKTDAIDKDGLFWALGLIGMQQSGFSPDMATLQEATELPAIKIDNLHTLQQTAERDNIAPEYSFRELEESEFIQVNLGKEAGMFKKHTTYTIFSKRRNVTCTRRYSDFEPLDALLRKRFPYRIIPQLPPKTFGGNKNKSFLQKRRKALERYLTFVCRHPVMRDDEALDVFFTYEGGDLQSRLKDMGKVAKDEFQTNPLALHVEQHLPDNIAAAIQSTHTELEPVLATMKSLRETAEKVVATTETQALLWTAFAADIKKLGLSQMSHVAGHNKAQALETGLRDTSNLLKSVVDRREEQCVREMDGLVHNLQNLHEILSAFRDLLTRRLKGIAKDVGSTVKKQTRDRSRLSSSSDGAESAKLEAKIQQRDSALQSLAAVNNFSMYCVWCESKLIKANIAQIGTMLEEMVTSQITGHKQMASAWTPLLDTVTRLVQDLHLE
ncbi:hypothetical protein PTSG_02134 [Salpingoeca rosetta]|uniref:PX domain-containing protein n=1 Tax=Salpingoeca rosetta (strain ATCC 50818 / BSB-021) TaxID=946362 RepID=F2U1B0_SALR5|nr:uncharacterized protein PTSG_02134 [Salpingoeca rosetta]EGD81412.1 hypothetical protein PTSG_02134 [Salpingoeca rosetta]|eukprot:XP_004996616.1 hypothetical protein PTSG_02134 [Salpingoeca rosetta]